MDYKFSLRILLCSITCKPIICCYNSINSFICYRCIVWKYLSIFSNQFILPIIFLSFLDFYTKRFWKNQQNIIFIQAVDTNVFSISFTAFHFHYWKCADCIVVYCCVAYKYTLSKFSALQCFKSFVTSVLLVLGNNFSFFEFWFVLNWQCRLDNRQGIMPMKTVPKDSPRNSCSKKAHGEVDNWS